MCSHNPHTYFSCLSSSCAAFQNILYNAIHRNHVIFLNDRGLIHRLQFHIRLYSNCRLKWIKSEISPPIWQTSVLMTVWTEINHTVYDIFSMVHGCFVKNVASVWTISIICDFYASFVQFHSGSQETNRTVVMEVFRGRFVVMVQCKHSDKGQNITCVSFKEK